MRDNWSLSVVGSKVALVPYRKQFVEKYNGWMQDPDILEATASEPLSLKEEYEMQELWKNDPTKCTFLIMFPSTVAEGSCVESQLVGDVNLFMHDQEDRGNAEIEIMIADKSVRRKGCAQESLSMMVKYGVTELHIHRFFAKIGKSNESSIKLFKRMGFEECNFVECFEEYEFELCTDKHAAVLSHIMDSVSVTSVFHDDESTIEEGDL